jgi:hypothetical protein
MKWILLAVVIVAVLVVVVAVVGALLPRDHVASRTLTTRRPADELWALVSNPAFARDATGQDVPVETVESTPPGKLLTRIADPNQPFGGTWTFVITPTPTGSTLTITEAGWVSNVIFRFVSRFIMGHHATMDTYLRNVAKRLNEDLQLSGE